MNTTIWRWFPIGLFGAMGFVFLVNGYMVYNAVTTFPGSAGKDGFDLSNDYKRVLAAAHHQSDLGWTIDADVTGTRQPTLSLTNKSGDPLQVSDIEARAERPVGPAESTPLSFQPAGPGHFQASTDLAQGQWDILLTVQSEGQTYTATRRVVAR
jgi:nitrogen fixation protein FixH